MPTCACDVRNRYEQNLDWWAGRARTLRYDHPPIRVLLCTDGPSPKTVLAHRFSRNMSGWPSGHASVRAREDRKTHRPTDREKVCPLTAGAVVCAQPKRLGMVDSPRGVRLVKLPSRSPRIWFDSRHRHSEDTAFPFQPFFMDRVPMVSPLTRLGTSRPLFGHMGTALLSLGGFSCFGFFLSLLLVPVPGL